VGAWGPFEVPIKKGTASASHDWLRRPARDARDR
jgi:hypothetical protein